MQGLWIYPEDTEVLGVACKSLLKALKPCYQKIALFSPIRPYDGGCEGFLGCEGLNPLEFHSAIDKQKALELVSAAQEELLFETILKRYDELQTTHDFVINLGYVPKFFLNALLDLNTTLAKRLNAPIVAVVQTSLERLKAMHFHVLKLDTQVLVFGDCAIIPNPSPKELAEIAITSAQSAKQFNIAPKVALLSYATGNSAQGEMIDKINEAREIAQRLDPQLEIDGPLQFDASIDKSVAKKKMPNSQVAGQASVFIFPDLNAGNIAYKAVQRSAKAVAIGPILQGLNKPINDLSRGALVEDIINTVLISAIQAQD
ncbi:phosphate acyltransferase [Helicobacter pylori]|uniref:phosphate acyltransferase n=1 Tax=Helicobacter pylori TaxID=210 RepID=UPI001E5BA731|nr:phosphate acyltransferase [Helicobacter pylori]